MIPKLFQNYPKSIETVNVNVNVNANANVNVNEFSKVQLFFKFHVVGHASTNNIKSIRGCDHGGGGSSRRRP